MTDSKTKALRELAACKGEEKTYIRDIFRKTVDEISSPLLNELKKESKSLIMIVIKYLFVAKFSS